MENPIEVEKQNRIKFGELLRKIRERVKPKLARDTMLKELTYLVFESLEDNNHPLNRLKADTELKFDKDDEGQIASKKQIKPKNEGEELITDRLLYTSSDIGKYERGKSPVLRPRVLLFIYYFRQKGKDIITFKEANELIGYIPSPQGFHQLREDEIKIIFGDKAASESAPQLTITAIAVKQEKSTVIVPATIAALDEMLIVIARFSVSVGNTDAEIYYEIEKEIIKKAQKIGETAVRVEIAPLTLHSRQRAEAEELGQQYNASIVIWGHDSGVRVTVNFLYLRHPDFEAAVATIDETERTQIANPSEYNQFIVDDLPKRLTFLSLFAIAHKYYIDQDYAHATTLLEEAIGPMSDKTKLEGLAEAYYRLGWLYQMQTPNNSDQAIINYNKAIHLKPDNTAIYNNRGNARLDQGRLDDAIADYNQAIHLKPDNATAYYNRGLARSKQGRLDDAIADYNQAIHLKPDDATAYYSRGNTHHDQGKLDDAIADYNQAIHLRPDDAATYNNRGLTRYDQGRLDDAIADYNRALRLKPDDATAYNNRIYAYSKQEMLQDIMLKENFYIEKLELIKVGAIAFFNSAEGEDIRELAIKTSRLNTVPDIIEFTSTIEFVDSNGLSDDIIEPTKYMHRKSEISDNLFSTSEVMLAEKHDGICVFLVIGTNPNREKCFIYFALRVEKINHFAKMIQEGRITRSIMKRVIHYGLGTPGQKDIDDMFDNWGFSVHKTTVKCITETAEQLR